MKLADVNILVTAHRPENVAHELCRSWLDEHVNGPLTFAYCEWILSAFVRIVTHPRIYRDPTPPDQALAFARLIRERPNGISIMPGRRHWSIFERLCAQTGARGNDIPDAYLAALAIESTSTFVTADRGFERYRPELTVQVVEPE